MAANLPVPERATRRRPRRWAVAGLVGVIASTLGVFVPTPTVVSAQELEVHTEAVTLAPRTTDRTRDAVGAAAGTAEGIELRSALAAADRRSAPRHAARYHAIGVTLPEAPDAPVLVRGRVDGTWTPWLELPFEDGEAPDLGSDELGTATEVHSEPVWMGDADAYELDAPGDVRSVDVHLVADGPTTRRVVAQPAAAGAAGAAGAPSILGRSAWGAQPPRQHPSTTADLKIAIVHHSVNSNTYSAAQVPELLRSIQAYHQQVKGWQDIAYNFVVDRFGRTWEGRAGGTTNVVVGGHSQGFNTGAVGVVALGDFRNASAPAATVEAIARVIAWKFAIHRVDPASRVPYTSAGSAKYAEGTTVSLPRIVGHRDVQATDCPGGRLYSRLGTIRTRVAQLVPEYQKGISPTMLALDLGGDGLIDPLQYQPGTVADVHWKATGTTLVPTALGVSGTYRPVVGDFDGNGRDDVFWHGSGSTPDSIWWHTPAGRVSQPLDVLGSYVPIVGDFDANGVDDVYWYGTGLVKDSVWYFETDRTHSSLTVKEDLITGVPLVGDFNADGRDDVYFYGPGSADDRMWRSKGRSWSVSMVTVSGWYSPVVLDATGDGHDDIVWVAPGASTSYRWTFDAAGAHTSTSFATTPVTGRPYVGDFDGDGLDDVLVIAAGAAWDAAWYSTPTGVDARSVSVTGSYASTSGPMDAPIVTNTGDVIFVSGGPDYFWKGLPGRTFQSTRVG